jgi:hypothetical protein
MSLPDLGTFLAVENCRFGVDANYRQVDTSLLDLQLRLVNSNC